MKKKLLIILFILPISILAQVGIETTSPTKTLDVNGEMRVRITSTNLNDPAAKDSILVVDNLGNINRTSSKKVVNSYLKTVVKGKFSSSSVINLSLISSKALIPFDAVEFDINSEFNTSTNTFTAKQDGIYSIKIQIKSDATVGAATNFGVAISKNGSIISRNSFANISLLSTNVTPPIRSLESLVQLNTGDTINFNIVSDLISVSILGTSEDCFFTIQQIR
jgi:C1q domain